MRKRDLGWDILLHYESQDALGICEEPQVARRTSQPWLAKLELLSLSRTKQTCILYKLVHGIGLYQEKMD